MKKLSLILASLITALLFVIGSVRADIVIPDRPLYGIYDPNHYLSSNVSDRLRELNSKSDTQIAIYIVDSLEGESLEKSANSIAKSWEIGYTDTKKGALLLIAIKDRKFRLEISKNLAMTLTDAKAKEILDVSRTKMRAQDYDGAVIDMIQNISNQDYDLADEPVVERNYFYEVPKAIWDLLVEILDHFGVIFMISFLVLLLTEGRVSDRKRRSNRFYHGRDKLYPYEKDFINDGSWSSDDWSGGGFDGGGSSSDW